MPHLIPRHTHEAQFVTTRSPYVQVLMTDDPSRVVWSSVSSIILPRRLSVRVDGSVSFGTVESRYRVTVEPLVWLSTSPPPDDPEEWDRPCSPIVVKGGSVALPHQFLSGELEVPGHDSNANGLVWVAVGLRCISTRRARLVSLAPPPCASGKVTI